MRQQLFNKMQRYTVYLYLQTALHGSGVIYTHHQELILLYLQYLALLRPLRATCRERKVPSSHAHDR